MSTHPPPEILAVSGILGAGVFVGAVYLFLTVTTGETVGDDATRSADADDPDRADSGGPADASEAGASDMPGSNNIKGTEAGGDAITASATGARAGPKPSLNTGDGSDCGPIGSPKSETEAGTPDEVATDPMGTRIFGDENPSDDGGASEGVTLGVEEHAITVPLDKPVGRTIREQSIENSLKILFHCIPTIFIKPQILGGSRG